MGGFIDLHIHSNNSSDGDVPCSLLIDLAKEKDLKAISITDHDSVAAYPGVINLGKKAGIEVIPGIELTTVLQDREFHLLLLFVDWNSESLIDLVSEVAQRRTMEAKDRIDRLKKLGFDITWEEVRKESKPFPPLGVNIAQALLKKARETGQKDLKKYLKEENELMAPYLFYKDYFMEGKPASVPRRNLNIMDVLQKVPITGGVPVLAHPGAYFQKATRPDLVLLKENGLVGLEVYTSYHDGSLTEWYKAYAKDLDLVPTAGSDFHGSIKPQINLGFIQEGGYWMVEELKKRRPM